MGTRYHYLTFGQPSSMRTDLVRCAVVISHDRWFLDRIATHILAFEGESMVTFFDGNFSEYEEWRRQTLGDAATRPHRITYRKLTALGAGNASLGAPSDPVKSKFLSMGRGTRVQSESAATPDQAPHCGMRGRTDAQNPATRKGLPETQRGRKAEALVAAREAAEGRPAPRP